MKHINYVVTLFEKDPDNSKITIAFTMAINAARKGLNPVVILMGDAVALGAPEQIENINIGDPFASCKDMLKELLEKNGQVAVCESCLLFKNMQPSDLDPRFPRSEEHTSE